MSDALRILVVDDEALARERIVTLLGDRAGIEVLGECADGLEAVEQIAKRKPDLVFLDVQMPGLDGFEVLAALASNDAEPLPVPVFVTAYDEYALKAFEVNAVDYLLKPIDSERFEEALARATRMVQGGDRSRVLGALDRRPTRARRLVGRRGSGFVVVPHDEIERNEAAGNYLRVFSSDGEALVRCTMKAMEARLDPAHFLRIHRSTLVHLAHARSVTPTGHGEFEVVLTSGKRLKCSRAYGTALRRALEL